MKQLQNKQEIKVGMQLVHSLSNNECLILSITECLATIERKGANKTIIYHTPLAELQSALSCGQYRIKNKIAEAVASLSIAVYNVLYESQFLNL